MMMTTGIELKGAAVHTRDIQRGKDYGWYVRKGDLSLYDQTEDIYRVALRDVSGDTRKFALIIADNRVGLLLCDMASERIDHGNRTIYDTLYTEFAGTEETNLLEYAACLLTYSDTEYEILEKLAVTYAELIYQNIEKLGIRDDFYPLKDYQTTVEPKTFSGKRALRYKGVTEFPADVNVQKCAAYLKYLATKHGGFVKESFVFISTGRVGLDRCKHVANNFDTCLILTMTSEVDTEIALGEFQIIPMLKKYFFKDKAYKLIFILKKKHYLKDIFRKLLAL